MRVVDRTFLTEAKKNKNDEFYTLRSDIERELEFYPNQFVDKVVYCNCDDPEISNFVAFFRDNFQALQLKKLLVSAYNSDGHGTLYEYTGPGHEPRTRQMNGNGDFRSPEALELLHASDVVVTNPPFSLFRDFISLVVNYDKQFLVIGNVNAITYKEIFPLIQDNRAWLGVHLGRGISGFIVPEEYELYGTEARIDVYGNRIISPNNCLWLTNLTHTKRYEDIPLTKTYKGNEDAYPHYDNYDGININKTKDIPADYMGHMGVPITFLHKHNPEQFDIIKFRKGDDGRDLAVNGKCPYFRIIICRADTPRADTYTARPSHKKGHQNTLW